MAGNGVYDVVGAFQGIEEELIDSMMRNMKNHIGDELTEGINWSQWQAEMLRGLQQYKTENADKLEGYYSTINDKIDKAIREAYATGESEQEIEILQKLKQGFKPDKTGVGTDAMRGAFFKVNERKMNALIDSTTSDFKRGEQAILRRTEDAYRQIIFKSQMYYSSGAGTLWQAVDKASHDFLAQGINCIQYKNGARVNIVSYSEMAMRTASKRANLAGAASKRAEYGIDTVKVTSRGTACPMCAQWLGLVYYDDVYGHGDTRKEGKYPLLSTAVSGGLFHPNCKDGLATYYEGVSRPAKPLTEDEQKEAIRRYNLEQRQRTCERNIRKYTRLSNGAIDAENAANYTARLQQWQAEYKSLIRANGDVLRADPARLRLYGLDKINESTFNTPIPKYKGGKQEAAKKSRLWSDFAFDNKVYNNKKEIAEHWVKDYGIKFSDSRKAPFDKGIMQDCANWLDKFNSKFTAFNNSNALKIPVIKLKADSGMSGAVGYYQYYSGSRKPIELALNSRFHGNPQYFESYLERIKPRKHNVENASTVSTFVHEYGHHVSNSLCVKYGSSWEHDFITECVEEFKKQEPSFTGNSYKGLTDYLSRYGSTKESECFAEAFSEYFGGENPRKFAQIFGEKLEKVLTEVK